MEADAFNTDTGTSLLKLGRAVSGTNSSKIGKKRDCCTETFQDPFDGGTEATESDFACFFLA
jgi:hypothetical protein